MISPSVESAARLAAHLLNRWVATGGTPRVPAERRDEVVATLNRCMACAAVRSAYLGALTVGWSANRHRPPLAGYPAGDIPEEIIARDGFGTLDDVSLGDMAVCPEAIEAMHYCLTTPPSHPDEFLEAGDWFFTELDAVEASLIPPSRPAGDTTQVQLGDQNVVAKPVVSAPATLAQPRGIPIGRWRKVLPWAVAVAASVVAALLWLTRPPGPGRTDPETLLARATPAKVVPKGANATALFELEVAAEREGFVTVVILPAGGKPEVEPDYGRDERRVTPDAPATVGPFEAPNRTPVITVVTATPATDLVRRVVLNLPPDQATSDRVKELVRDKLFASGHKWVALGASTVILP